MKRLLWWLIGFTAKRHWFHLSARLLNAYVTRYPLYVGTPGSQGTIHNVVVPTEPSNPDSEWLVFPSGARIAIKSTTAEKYKGHGKPPWERTNG